MSSICTKSSSSLDSVQNGSRMHQRSSGAASLGPVRRPSVARALGHSAVPKAMHSSTAVSGGALAPRVLAPENIRGANVVAAAKKKGGKGGGSSSNGNSFKSPGNIREDRSAYKEETRKIILSLEKINKASPQGKELLKNISLGMYLGAKIGILGANGSGKSTLMRILAQKDNNFNGRMTLVPGVTIGFLEQEPVLADGDTVQSNVEPAVKHIRDMVAEFEAISMKMSEPDANIDALSMKMDRLQTQIDAVNGWEIERTMDQAMDALRCPPGDAKIASLSGGEARRVALARLLLNPPDILLLDEPTNHLDALSVAWLEQFLASFKGTVVAVTHDRYFLDNVAGWILELDRGQGIPFEGNYSEWLEAKDKRLRVEQKQQTNLQKTIQKELEWTRTQAKGQQKKGAARLRQYDQLVEQASQFVRQSSVDSITIPVGPRLGDKVLEMKDVTKTFGDRVLLDNFNLSVPPGSVIGIIGGNGAGKSTLFRMIMGYEKPDKGDIRLGETAVPMYVDQSRENLDPTKTVFDVIAEGSEEVDLNGRKINTRAYCSWYNFKSVDQQKKVGDLSGGERNRLHLAKTLKQSGNLLLLDEPTNDLDVETLRCLEDAVERFAGSVLIISHDRWFLNRMATHILAFEDDANTVFFQGSFSEYEEDWKKRSGVSNPGRVKFRRLANV